MVCRTYKTSWRETMLCTLFCKARYIYMHQYCLHMIEYTMTLKNLSQSRNFEIKINLVRTWRHVLRRGTSATYYDCRLQKGVKKTQFSELQNLEITWKYCLIPQIADIMHIANILSFVDYNFNFSRYDLEIQNNFYNPCIWYHTYTRQDTSINTIWLYLYLES